MRPERGALRRRLRALLRPLASRVAPLRSLAVWLAAAFAVTLAALLLATSSWVYWSLSARMMQEDREALLHKLEMVATLLRSHAVDGEALREAALVALPVGAPRDLFVRVRAADGRILLATPGFDPRLRERDFPAPRANGRPRMRTLRLGHDVHYLVAALPASVHADAAAPAQPARLEVALDRSAEARILENYTFVLEGVMLLAVLFAAVAGYAIAWRGLRPLRRMAEAAQAISAHSLHQRLDARRLPAELRTLAESFNATLARLEDAFGRISQFSADIAHELRTPIHNLLGELEVTLGRPRAGAEYRAVLESALEECGRLSRLIQGLLFLAQAEQPGQALRRESAALARELAALAEFYEAAAAEAGVTLALECDPALTVNADRLLLQRALGNLVSNALTHTPAGGRVLLYARREGEDVCLGVADTGCGIAAAHLPHLFERFYRADPARARRAGGVGLGLALVRGIARLHGGEAHAESAPGRGTRVWMTLPGARA